MTFDLSQIEYIDIHSHLQFKSYAEDRVNVLKRMKEAKVATIAIGTDFSESSLARDLAKENENVFYSIALHPYDNLEEFEKAYLDQKNYFEKLKSLAGEKCLAIGETGLDYFYLYKNKRERKIKEIKLKEAIEKQKIIFKKHIDLALELDLPLMLHIRPSEEEGDKEDAYLDVLEILKEYQKRDKNLRGNFHFFVSTKKVLNIILKDFPSFTISIPAVCTFTNEYDEIISSIPKDRLHIETDSPFVLPKNKRKIAKQNEPTFVIEVFLKIAEIKNLKSDEEKEEFKKDLKNNFKRLFLK